MVCFHTNRKRGDCQQPASQSVIGIDMGIANFATFSDGNSIQPLNSFRKHEKQLAALQHVLAKKVKVSENWRKQKAKVARLHKKIADVRNDFFHKTTTTISKNHAVVVLEDLKVKNVSASASGSLESPGRNVRLIPPQYTSQTCHICGCVDKTTALRRYFSSVRLADIVVYA
jgi:putative transposase